MPGTLFVVATPIGNLEDLSFRALRVLRQVDAIAAEDTRRTAKLLAHYEIRKPLISLHAHNEYREAPRLVTRLERGESIALVTDAGTPGISDPGSEFVRLARERTIVVSPVPGPSAVMAALSVSGLAADRFSFLGFPPRSGSARKEWMERLASRPETCVFFEAPHRIDRTLADVGLVSVNRPIQCHRELTKIHEQLVIYTNVPGSTQPSSRGEYVVIVGPASAARGETVNTASQTESAVAMFGCMTVNGAFGRDEAETLVSRALGMDEQAVRKAVKRHRISEDRKRQSLS